jgi:hypothetical protein
MDRVMRALLAGGKGAQDSKIGAGFMGKEEGSYNDPVGCDYPNATTTTMTQNIPFIPIAPY